MIKNPLLCMLVVFQWIGFASAEVPRPRDVLLWEGDVPRAAHNATRGADDGSGRYWGVGVPSMWVYSPAAPAPPQGRMAIIACCGGGYTHLTRLVGADGALEHFLPQNVVLVALRYRTTPPSTSVEEDAREDGKRAIRVLRANAKAWGVDPDRIGVIGWSAGANLALNLASHYDEGDAQAEDPVDRLSSRPSFVTLLSPWPCRPPRTSDSYPIGPHAPPAFIASAEDDKTAPVEFARSVAAAYEKSGADHRLFVVESGGHGAFRIGAPGEGGTWPKRFWIWMKAIGMRD